MSRCQHGPEDTCSVQEGSGYDYSQDSRSLQILKRVESASCSEHATLEIEDLERRDGSASTIESSHIIS